MAEADAWRSLCLVASCGICACWLTRRTLGPRLVKACKHGTSRSESVGPPPPRKECRCLVYSRLCHHSITLVLRTASIEPHMTESRRAGQSRRAPHALQTKATCGQGQRCSRASAFPDTSFPNWAVQTVRQRLAMLFSSRTCLVVAAVSSSVAHSALNICWRGSKPRDGRHR